jgi:Mn-dependent DtxR family transcriptional regulator
LLDIEEGVREDCSVTHTISATEISENDRAYLKQIQDYTRKYSVPPTYDNLATLMDRSIGSARFAVKRLVESGMVERRIEGHRNLFITELGYIVLSRTEQAS